MTPESMEQDFRRKVSAKIRLSAEGVDRFHVFTPFPLNDGDHPTIVLRREGVRWVLSDEGNTYMRLGCGVAELDRDGRRKTVSKALSTFQIEDRKSELLVDVPDGRCGDALNRFVQALLLIAGGLTPPIEVVGETEIQGEVRAKLNCKD